MKEKKNENLFINYEELSLKDIFERSHKLVQAKIVS